MNRRLDKILTGMILTAGAALLGWTGYDSMNSKMLIKREAKEKELSIYEVCKEKGRSDVIDMAELENAVKTLRSSPIYPYSIRTISW